jgi:hypothetical protein
MSRRASLSSIQGSNRERCGHSGYYSGVGLYSHDERMMRYVLVCDECGEEMKEISSVDYAPQPVSVGA